MSTASPPHICVCGTNDFVLRMSAAIQRHTSLHPETGWSLARATLGETRTILRAERPDVLVVDIGPTTTMLDTAWLHNMLTQTRERFGNNIYIILAITTPSRFVAGGNMLFADQVSLTPSHLINNILISPPPNIPSILSLEKQLINCIEHFVEWSEHLIKDKFSLPALWDDDWVPVMCAPESREVWMRWLPRYAKYINENPIILGSTGTGKTRLAKAIHTLSGRSGPFVVVTPRDFSSTELMQAELFGAAAGAYTGAVDKWGLVKKAEEGTLFIDELQSIGRELQGKLITFIENKTYRRVGEAETHKANVRFVFATNRPLPELVSSGKLRDDFAYRLERLNIELPSLNHRRLDISAGICFALAKILRERSGADSSRIGTAKRQIEGLTPEAYRILFASMWPGNFRQLENTIAKLVELADIHHLTLINRECTAHALNDMLGTIKASATDVFEQATTDVMKSAQASGYDTMQHAMNSLADAVRCRALELSGGSIDKAASLINDSKNKMKLFATASEAYRESTYRESK